jgi:hypothetical protein
MQPKLTGVRNIAEIFFSPHSRMSSNASDCCLDRSVVHFFKKWFIIIFRCCGVTMGQNSRKIEEPSAPDQIYPSLSLLFWSKQQEISLFVAIRHTDSDALLSYCFLGEGGIFVTAGF